MSRKYGYDPCILLISGWQVRSLDQSMLTDLSPSFTWLRGQLDWHSPTGDIRHFTLTQRASGISQIFPAKKLQADFCSGSQSVAGVNRQLGLAMSFHAGQIRRWRQKHDDAARIRITNGPIGTVPVNKECVYPLRGTKKWKTASIYGWHMHAYSFSPHKY